MSKNLESVCPLCGKESGIEVPRKWWQKLMRRPKVYHCWSDSCGAVYEIDPRAPKIVDPEKVKSDYDC